MRYWKVVLTRLSIIALLSWAISQLARLLIYPALSKHVSVEAKWALVIFICIFAGTIAVTALWPYLPIRKYLPRYLKTTRQRSPNTFPFRF